MKLCGSLTQARTSTRPGGDSGRGVRPPAEGERRSSSADVSSSESPARRSESHGSWALPVDDGCSFPPRRSGLTTIDAPVVRTNSLRWTCHPPSHVQPMCCPGIHDLARSRRPDRCARIRSAPIRTVPRRPCGVASDTRSPPMANTRCVRPGGAPRSGRSSRTATSTPSWYHGSALGIRPRIEERPPDRMLLLDGAEPATRATCRCRPAEPRASPAWSCEATLVENTVVDALAKRRRIASPSSPT